MTIVAVHNKLLEHGFEVCTNVDPRDLRNIRNIYTREEGWFRVRLVFPAAEFGRPSLWIDLRCAKTGLGWADDNAWLSRRSQLARSNVASVLENALGFLSVVRIH